MYQVIFIIQKNDEDELTQRLFDLSAGSVTAAPLDDGRITLTALFEDPESIRSSFPEDSYNLLKLEDDDWKYRWMEDFHGFEVNRDIYIEPYPPENNSSGHLNEYEYLIFLDPRDAFGDGRHPTTFLCMKSIYNTMKNLAPEKQKSLRALDAGTGTGLLAILTSLMGAEKIDAIDIDDDSIKRASLNLSLNRCENINLTTTDLAHFSTAKKYDLITANLLTGIIMENILLLKSMLVHNGTMIISGISDKWDGQIRELFHEHGLKLLSHLRQEEWNCYIVSINP